MKQLACFLSLLAGWLAGLLDYKYTYNWTLPPSTAGTWLHPDRMLGGWVYLC